MIKRLFDIVFAFFGIILLFPVFLIVALGIAISSPGSVIYRQTRIGKNVKRFTLYKFRTMRTDADKQGLLTVGGKDKRITPIGYILRKYKLDELAQLFNILNGSMSFVGPRPEVEKYVKLYSEKQREVLKVRPGLTDPASLAFINENEILESYDDPESAYINKIMPEKLKINQEYLEKSTFLTDIKIIIKTFGKIFRN